MVASSLLAGSYTDLQSVPMHEAKALNASLKKENQLVPSMKRGAGKIVG